MDELIRLLEAQNNLLSQILNKLDKPALGLSNAAGPMRIYANRSNGCLWYTVTDGTPQPIQQAALTGYLTDLTFPRLERRGKDTVKLQAHIEGDRPYIVESGYESNFSRGLLLAVAQLTPAQLQRPITIAPQAGSDDSVLFCRLYYEGQPIKALYDDSTNWRAVAQAAVASVRGGPGAGGDRLSA